MNIIRNILGPESKYDKTLPYTYEARVPIVEGHETYNTYLSDTICGLIGYLRDNGIKPEEAKIFEVYQTQESLVKTELCTTADDNWLPRTGVCRSFCEGHYEGENEIGKCSFKDRSRDSCGP